MSNSSNNNGSPIPEDLSRALLDAIAPITPAPERTTAMHARILDRVRQDLKEPAADLVTVSKDAGEWVETGPGNSIKMLRTDDETLSMLARLDPGTTFPSHSHSADEETMVLEGEAWFGDIHLVAGDYHLAPAGTVHGEVRTATGCLLFIRMAAE